MSREKVAWALVGLFNLLALVILGMGLARAAGYTTIFSWQSILGIALATLLIAVLLLRLLIRR